MGNNNTGKSSFEEHNWRKLEENGEKTILYNDVTKKSIERHEAVLDCDQGEAIEICKWRENLNSEFCVVELYEYGVKRAGMCTAQPDLYVVTQRICLLRDIGTISKPEAFLILRDVATGLRVLFKKFGFFNPRPNLIGINSEGRAKVWTNQNFAKFLPQKDTIPIETTELGVMNNLIRILESKTAPDNGAFPLQYPRNLDFSSAVKYINNIFTSLSGYEVDRVYIDRAQYSKKHKQLKDKVQMEQLSRTKAIQAEHRLREIQQLQQNLRNQQLELQRKEQLLKMASLQQQQQLHRQHQQETQRQQQLQLQRQQMQMQLQMQRQRDSQTYYATQPGVVTIDNSQGKVMKGTTSTIQSQVNYPANVVYYSNAPYAQNNGLLAPQQAYVVPPQPQQQQFRQSAVSNAYQQPAQQRQRQLSPRPPIPQSNGQAEMRRKNSVGQERMKKEIEMVDSMILMQEDDLSEHNKNYVESRIIHYQM